MDLGVFHIANAVFEGSIGLCHLILPDKVYGHAAVAPTQVLFGRFFGLMMLSISLISLLERKNRAVDLSLACYHATACVLNATLGCGIDGTKSSTRDWFHCVVHGTIGLGFAWMVFLPNTSVLTLPATTLHHASEMVQEITKLFHHHQPSSSSSHLGEAASTDITITLKSNSVQVECKNNPGFVKLLRDAFK